MSMAQGPTSSVGIHHADHTQSVNMRPRRTSSVTLDQAPAPVNRKRKREVTRQETFEAIRDVDVAVETWIGVYADEEQGLWNWTRDNVEIMGLIDMTCELNHKVVNTPMPRENAERIWQDLNRLHSGTEHMDGYDLVEKMLTATACVMEEMYREPMWGCYWIRASPIYGAPEANATTPYHRPLIWRLETEGVSSRDYGRTTIYFAVNHVRFANWLLKQVCNEQPTLEMLIMTTQLSKINTDWPAHIEQSQRLWDSMETTLLKCTGPGRRIVERMMVAVYCILKRRYDGHKMSCNVLAPEESNDYLLGIPNDVVLNNYGNTGWRVMMRSRARTFAMGWTNGQ